MPRRRVVLLVLLAASAAFTVSYVPYLTGSNEDLASKTVMWARDHGLGGLVTKAEQLVSRVPPPRTPAASLTLNEELTQPGPARTTPTSPSLLPSSTTLPPPPSPAPSSPTPSTPPTTTLPPPAALKPAVTPALDGEGEWKPVASANGTTAVWATSLRPLASYPGVTATYAVIDQTHLRAALFNGTSLPGGRWKLGSRVPGALRDELVAAFNGGFRFEHAPGSGYRTEGRTLHKPTKGLATLVVAEDGTLHLGEWGRDIDPAGRYLSVRQNLPLLVSDGVSHGSKGAAWGLDYGGIRYVLRSAVCELADGRLMYVIAHKVDALLLGEILTRAGCTQAMQLDINGNWPSLYVFDDGNPRLLDSKVGAPRHRYLNGSTKDFFAFFDRSTLTPGVLPE
jgi:hypothetical protein